MTIFTNDLWRGIMAIRFITYGYKNERTINTLYMNMHTLASIKLIEMKNKDFSSYIPSSVEINNPI